MKQRLLFVLLLALLFACSSVDESRDRWWKGNIHSHTLWSDGDAAPEIVTDWYKRNGYNFLVLSDHNELLTGEKWFTVSDDQKSRLTPARVDELRRRFGREWVVERQGDIECEMKLKTLAELRGRFGRPDHFILIPGMEISFDLNGKLIDVNVLYSSDFSSQQSINGSFQTQEINTDAIIEKTNEVDRPSLQIINHPNHNWHLSRDEIAYASTLSFFEVYNGHPLAWNSGDDSHPSTEENWDYSLVVRLTELSEGPLYGIASDDAHNYFTFRGWKANPGRSWVMVRAERLTPQSILTALHTGEFYASTGVRVDDFWYDESRFVIILREEPGEPFITQFIGTRRKGTGYGKVGEVLYETTTNPAVYEFTGDEIYVRAKVTTFNTYSDPYSKADYEYAWLQPVIPSRR